MTDTPGSAVAALSGGDNASAASTTTAAAPATQATTTTAPTEGALWYDKAPQELKGLVEKKGWKGPEDALKSYAELEKAFSGDKLVLPKDAADEAAWNAVYDKLGRPKAPADYKLPEGVDPKLAGDFTELAHKSGITQRQAEALAAWNLQQAQKVQETQQAAIVADQNAAMQKLESEWGNRTPAEIEINRRAMRQLGISVDEAGKFMAGGGAEKFMRLLNLAGSALKEDATGDLGHDSKMGFALTPNRAAAEIQRLKDDPQFVARWRAGDKGAKAKMDSLLAIKAGTA